MSESELSDSVVMMSIINRFSEEIDSLRTALHDAICRPLGVVPESAEKFVTDDELAAVRRALEDKIVLEPGAAVETHSKTLK